MKIKKEGSAINEQNDVVATRKKPWTVIGVIVSIVVLLSLVFMAMPRGFQMTHEDIGTGKPALVFIYDVNLVVSISQPEQMNIARDQLNDTAFFLIAKFGTVEGNQFIAEHSARAGELLLFDASGNLVNRQYALVSAEDLIQWLTP